MIFKVNNISINEPFNLEPFVPEPSTFEAEVSIVKFKR